MGYLRSYGGCLEKLYLSWLYLSHFLHFLCPPPSSHRSSSSSSLPSSSAPSPHFLLLLSSKPRSIVMMQQEPQPITSLSRSNSVICRQNTIIRSHSHRRRVSSSPSPRDMLAKPEIEKTHKKWIPAACSRQTLVLNKAVLEIGGGGWDSNRLFAFHSIFDVAWCIFPLACPLLTDPPPAYTQEKI